MKCKEAAQVIQKYLDCENKCSETVRCEKCDYNYETDELDVALHMAVDVLNHMFNYEDVK